MVYLVTNNELLKDSSYETISVEDSLAMLEPLKLIGFDTETQGLDCHSKKLLSMQLGCKDFQIVIDCMTVNVKRYKELLERTDKLFLGWNLKFDVKFMLTQGIVPRSLYDGYLAERLLWLGYPAGMHHLSLKAAGMNYIGVELDKSIRGQIIYKGLTPEVIEYAANDVKYLEDVIKEQRKALEAKGLLTAIEIENRFLLPLSYMEWCGIKLDVNKWKAKMVKDEANAKKAKEACDQWLIENSMKDAKDMGAYYLPDGSKAPDIDDPTLSPEQVADIKWFRRWVPNFVDYPKLRKFIKVDLQGDLFSDKAFDLEPRATINWESSKQVAEVFKVFNIDIEIEDKEKGGTKDSVGAKVLEPQASKCDLIPLYIAYKEATKVTSTYGENFLKQINPVTGRVHTQFNQLGADTTRITSGGKDKAAKVEYVNLLNLPSDEETRSCFIAEEGNRWISIDYSGQETYLMASIANDKAILKELTEGSGDIHSLTAYMSYPEIPRDTPIGEIKERYPNLRKQAKKVEFGINYGGDSNTISRNVGIPIQKAREIYNNYMSGFKGLKAYQAFRRKDWLDKGYILLSALTGHKAFIYDYEELLRVRKRFDEEGFWDYYRDMRVSAPDSETVQEVKRYFKRKSASERQNINYVIQAAGSMCLRISMIRFFNYLIQQGLVFKVLITVSPYDEINCEAPADKADEIAAKLHECMVGAGEIFCTRCHLDADISFNKDGTLPDHWVHD